MFNVTVLKIKDLVKYFVELILVIGIIFIATKILSQHKQEGKSGFLNYDLTGCIDVTSEIIKDTNKNEVSEKKAYKSDFFEDILRSQIGSVEDFEIKEENDKSNTKDDKKTAKETNSNDVELAKTGLTTEVTTKNPIPQNYNVQYGKVKIKNKTSHKLTNDILKPDITIKNKRILLFHTHTCESYTASEKYKYKATGNFRTTDLNFSVARVGEELTNHLKKYGYDVIHNKTYHDYPSYNGSYTNSLETVQKITKKKPTDIIFDIHRDAIGSRSDYAPVVKIGEKDIAAQIMFVIGSDEGGLWHPNWKQNLKFAIKVQQKAEEMYPGLFKPITLTKYRYNQHCGKYASIIEVGATGNTMEQCLTSMKYLSKVLDEVIK